MLAPLGARFGLADGQVRPGGCDQIVVAHGISANSFRFAKLEQTMDQTGYRPTDDDFRVG
jgi:hypothetical protein